MSFDATNYHGWHGISPMADFFRESDPSMFLVRGDGVHVTDRAGRTYLDARSGMWNATLGYSCEPVKAAIRRQLDDLPSGTVMRYEHPNSVAADYADALAAVLPEPLNYIRFGNTGSQMTEAAAMLSRFVRRMTGEKDRNHVIALHDSYHGTGPLATRLTGEAILHDYSAPLDGYVRHCAAPAAADCEGDDCAGECIAPVLALVDEIGSGRVTAVMLEPLAGTYIQTAPAHYLHTLLAACRERGIHLIIDEVTTGAGRVGAMTMCGTIGLVPDMLVLGKGISAGYFPLAALAVAAPLYDALFDPADIRLGFPNGSTTDGHPLGMAAGLAVLDLITAPGFFDRVNAAGQLLRDLIATTFADMDCVRDTFGMGLMLGINFAYDDGRPWTVGDIDGLRLTCAEHGLLLSYSPGILPLLPPLTISDDECAELVTQLRSGLRDYLKLVAD
jgi:adenosylmethionine-8-amino-7-oxononanoate aminotransferase